MSNKVKNPFLYNGSLDMNVSLNRLMVNEIDKVNIEPELIGKYAVDILSTSVLIDCIKQKVSKLGLDIENIKDRELGIYLDQCFESKDLEVRNTAEEIARYLGRNLGYILLTLKIGNRISRTKRLDWTDEHWDYWSNIETIILAGGISNGNLGLGLKKYSEEVFLEANAHSYKIILADNSSAISSIGAARYITEKCENTMIFDLGQTFIKRNCAVYDEEKLNKLYILDSVKSLYMKWIYDDINEELEDSVKLDSYLLNVFSNTWNELTNKGIKLSNEISISIANYIINGKLNSRGGYGKLRLLSDEYDKFLAEQLSNIIGQSIKVNLIHDGTAAAATFAEHSNSAVITLGTAIGVGFPTTDIKLKPICEKIKYENI